MVQISGVCKDVEKMGKLLLQYKGVDVKDEKGIISLSYSGKDETIFEKKLGKLFAN